MGTEQIYPIGTVLDRRTPKGDDWDQVRVVGGGDDLIVTSNTAFTESKKMAVMDVRAQYDGDIPESQDEEEGRVILVNPGLSPEQIFAKQARQAAAAGEVPKGRVGKKRVADDESAA